MKIMKKKGFMWIAKDSNQTKIRNKLTKAGVADADIDAFFHKVLVTQIPSRYDGGLGAQGKMLHRDIARDKLKLVAKGTVESQSKDQKKLIKLLKKTKTGVRYENGEIELWIDDQKQTLS